MKLSKRLQMVADLVPPGSGVADIGTDHAYIPIYLVQNEISDFCIAGDIRKGPLGRAQKNIAAYGLEGKIKTCLAPGFDGIKAGQAQTGIIAGMGGDMIADILKNIPEGMNTIVMQPMTMVDKARRGVHGAGWSITQERLAREGKRLYHVIVAQDKPQQAYVMEFDYVFSPLLEKDSLYDEFLNQTIQKVERILKSLKQSGESDGRRDYYERYYWFLQERRRDI